jgi:hypothetical protein
MESDAIEEDDQGTLKMEEEGDENREGRKEEEREEVQDRDDNVKFGNRGDGE